LWLSMGDERFAPELQGQRLAAFAEAYGAIDLGDVLPALRAIQNEFSARPDVPANVREWAGRCRTWLTRHLNAVTAGYP
jgi:hypothetical protein